MINYALANAIYEAGFTISEFTRAANLPISSLKGYIYDGNKPNVSRAIMIADLLGKDVRDLWQSEGRIAL